MNTSTIAATITALTQAKRADDVPVKYEFNEAATKEFDTARDGMMRCFETFGVCRSLWHGSFADTMIPVSSRIARRTSQLASSRPSRRTRNV